MAKIYFINSEEALRVHESSENVQKLYINAVSVNRHYLQLTSLSTKQPVTIMLNQVRYIHPDY